MKKFKLVLTFIALFAVVGLIVGCSTTAQAEDSYVTLDINPSVELIVSPKDKVIYANPLNEDAEVLLVDLDLIGMDLEEAIDLIIETSIELGYIEADAETETYVSVQTINSDEAIQERVQQKVKEHVNKSFENRGMFGKAKDKEFNQDFLNEAETYGVNPGFLFLAKEAVALSDDLLLEDAVLLTRAELLDIVKQAREANKDLAMELRAEFQAERDLLFDEYHPQIEALEAQILTIETRIAEIDAELLAPTEETDVEALEAEKVTLNADLELLVADLEVLETELHDAMVVIRDEFHAESEALREIFKEAKQQRRNQYQETVNEFEEDMERRRDQMRDRIRDYQNEEDTTDEKTNGNTSNK